MSRSSVRLSGSPYVLEPHGFDDPNFDSPERAVFSVATPAGERFDAAWLEQVAPEKEIEWLWPGTIPLRKVTLLEGPAGAGKSQLALDLAARVTKSAPWPDGQPSSLPTADVLVVCRKNEAAAASARFQRAGGDLAKMFYFCEFQTFLPAEKTRDTRSIAFPYDFPALEHHVETHESFGMIIIDSLADFCRTPREVAETLVLLEELAARANVALIVTVPSNCRVDAQGRLRVTSRWPTDTVRSAWCVLPDPDDPLRRLFVAKRTNFCREPDGLAYRLGDRGVVWEAISRISPVDPLGQLSASDVCLADLLREGPQPASTVYRLGGERGFSPKQLRTAGERLGVACQRIGFSGKGHWSWSLPGARAEAGDKLGSPTCEQGMTVGTNDGRGNPEAGGDDAERRDGRSHAERGNESDERVCASSSGLGRPETLDGTRDQAAGRCPPAAGGGGFPGGSHARQSVGDLPAFPRSGDRGYELTGGLTTNENEKSMGIFGESLEDGRSRRRKRRTKRNRKKEQRLARERVPAS